MYCKTISTPSPIMDIGDIKRGVWCHGAYYCTNVP